MFQPGDIVIVRSNTMIGRIIRYVTHSWASHVAVYIGEGFVFEARPGGARAVPISLYQGSEWEYRVFRLMVAPEKKESFVNHMIQKAGRGYDYGQILSIAIKHIFNIDLKAQNKRLAICSELVYESAAEAGISVPEVSQKYIVPGDFLNWKLLSEVFS